MPDYDKSTLPDRIRWAAKRVGGIDQLAELTGTPRRTLGNYLASKTEPKASFFDAVAEQTGVSLDWLISGRLPEMRPDDGLVAQFRRREKLIARGLYKEGDEESEFDEVRRYEMTVSAGPGTFSDDEYVKDTLAFRRDWLTLMKLDSDKTACFDLVGDSMEPTLFEGDTLLFDLRVNEVTADAVYLLGIGEVLHVKRVQRLMNGLLIRSDNPRYNPETLTHEQAAEVRILGRLKWVGHVV